MLAACLHPLDRALEAQREPGDHDLLRVHVELGAEAAAGVRCDYAHLVARHADHRGDDVAHRVRFLRRGPDRQFAAHGVEVGQQAARLERHATAAGDAEALLEAVRRGAQSGVCVPVGFHHVHGDVARAVGVDEPGAGKDRRLDIEDRLCRVVVDFDRLDRLDGGSERLRSDGSDRLTHKADASRRERRPGGRLQPVMRKQLRKGLASWAEVGMTDDVDHARQGFRTCGIYSP